MPTVTDLTSQAGFVFEGTIERMGVATASEYRSSPSTAIVSVTKILKGPPSLAGYGGLQVTVEMTAPVSLAAGESAVFFTHGTHYGDGLVVREVGSLPAEATMETQVSDAMQTDSDAEMTQRLAEADMVITGTASAPKPMEAPAGTRRVSEHDPVWMVATITVENTDKGVSPGATKDILFASSKDIAWRLAPKVKEGDRGMWLLHLKDKFGRPAPAHAVVHPLDFQPIAQVERVRGLLRR
jgi:hypothetical protein